MAKRLPILRRIPNPLSLTVPLQDDLESVTSISDHEQPPEAGGLGPKRVAAIWWAIQALYDTGVYPGIQFCLMRRGEVILDRAIGHAWGNGPNDPEDEQPILLTPMRYSEGLTLGLSPIGLYGLFTGRAFGHLGFINILTWADPARGWGRGSPHV